MEVSDFFFGVADFFGVVDFLVAAFFAGAVGFAGPLVTRPDLVLPRTFSTSTMAGAWSMLAMRRSRLGRGTYCGRSFTFGGSVGFSLWCSGLLSGGGFLRCRSGFRCGLLRGADFLRSGSLGGCSGCLLWLLYKSI